jgi:hypothetical protein
MRIVIMVGVTALAVSTAQAQLKGQVVRKDNGLSAPAKSEVQVTSTNTLHRSLKHPQVVYSGIAVQAVKKSNPLQLINPLAPVTYGSGEENLIREPAGRNDGLKIFSVSF